MAEGSNAPSEPERDAPAETPADRNERLVALTAKVVSVLAVGLSLFQLYTAGLGAMTPIVQRAVHLGVILALAFILHPPMKGARKDRLTGWLAMDLVLTALSIGCCFYVVYFLDDIFERQGDWIAMDVVVGVTGVLLVLEACRRVIGWLMAGICLFFLNYAYFGPHMPELFAHKGYEVERVATTLFFTTEGVFGLPIGVAATFVFIFVLFGAFLEVSGGGNFFIDLAYSLTGRFSGGPAKTSVLASGLMGSVSGSAVGNVVATGSFTIPMMKRIGYSPHVAGAIEAAASTGGHVMPPIMGAGAFLMAEFTPEHITYLDIVKVAIVPAMLYYMTLLLFVHFKACKQGIKGLPREKLPQFWPVFKKGIHFVLPLMALITVLMLNVSPMMAGFVAVVSLYAASLLRKETRVGPVSPLLLAIAAFTVRYAARDDAPARELLMYAALASCCCGAVALLSSYKRADGERRDDLLTSWLPLLFALGVFAGCMHLGTLSSGAAFGVAVAGFVGALTARKGRRLMKPLIDALERGATNAVMVSVACAAAGIIVGIVSLTGLGLNFSNLVIELSMNIKVLAILLVGAASLVLGMGLPVTASYIVLVTLAGPALTSKEMGMDILVAHMIVFWYSQDANVTPPVSLASFAGAGVAGANPMRTAFVSWMLAKGLYIIPIVMAYRPLLCNGPWWEVVITMVSCAGGLLALASAMERYLLRTATWLEVVLLVIAATCLFWPDIKLGEGAIPAYVSDAIGAVLLVFVILSQRIRGQKTQVATA